MAILNFLIRKMKISVIRKVTFARIVAEIRVKFALVDNLKIGQSKDEIQVESNYLCDHLVHATLEQFLLLFADCKLNKYCRGLRKQRSYQMEHMRKSSPNWSEEEWHVPGNTSD